MALSLPVKVLVLHWKIHGIKEATIMKRITNIRTLAALLMASAAIVSCSVKEDIFEEETTIKEEPAVQPAKVYTLSVNATKGGDDEATKALSLDGKTLNATWAQNEEVTVYNKTKKVPLDGTLKAQSDGNSTTLKGSLTGTIENGDELILRFNSANYASQSGTLDYIAANCDFAEATITVSSVDGENNVIPTSTASFVNQQAIVKFILKDQDNNDLNVSNLTISAGSNGLVSAGGLRGSGTKTYHTGYTIDGGSGSTGGEGYDKLLDGNTGTKWCSNVKSDGVWYVEFHTASAVQVDGYKLTTGGDTQTYPERNPKNWTLKAKVNSGDAWTVIDTKTGNTDMPAANLSSVDFEADVQGIYQYFRLEVSAIQGGEWFQLSEMQLYGCSDREFSFRYGNVNVTPASFTNELTVALNNQSDASDTYTLTSVYGSYEYAFTKSGVRFESGKYYAITVKMTKGMKTLANATAEDIGRIVGADGRIYDTKAAAEAAGTQAVAMIAYFDTENNNGMAIALSDEDSMNWSTAKSTCEGKTAVSGAAWLLPSQGQWKAMFKAFGGNEEKYTGLNTALAAAGGDSSKLPMFGSYWTSSPDAGDYAWYVYLDDGVVSWGHGLRFNNQRVRACLVFEVSGSVAFIHPLAEATTADLGRIVGADGIIYGTKAAAEAAGTQAVAMIAYMGSETDHSTYKHGLAIALSDEGSMNWSTATSTCEGKDAVSGAAWLLPSRNQWKAMFKAFGGSDASFTGLNTALAAAGGDSSKLPMSGSYWSSSPDAGDYAWYVDLDDGVAGEGHGLRFNDQRVRACLAF